ncbi:MAG TPA: hypothetical protein DC000_05485 [Clostridiales bacterium]|nr:hypothetical protein [Clostridiales bacterium]
MDEEKVMEIFRKRIGRINVLAVITMLIVVPITIFMVAFNLYSILKYFIIIVYPAIILAIVYNLRCPICGLLAGGFVHFTKRCVSCGAKLLK